MTNAIERVTLTHLQIPLKEPLRISGGEIAVKDAILVTVETSQGIGIGECSPLAALDTPGGCWNDLAEQVAPRLLGKRFATIEDLAAVAATWRVSSFAAAGAETACWALLAQSRRETIAEMFGAAHTYVNMRVESGLALGLYPTVVELLKALDVHLAEGYRRVKIEIAPGRDVELVRAIRQHHGDVPLMVDANGAYTRDDFDVFRELDDEDLLMFEQPLAADDLDGMAALQAAVATPICLDESARTLELTAEAIRRGAGRIVNLKIQRLGGFGPALALHDLCHENGVACWVGSMPELGVGQAQGIHLATLANCKYPTDVQPSARWFVDDYVVPPLELAMPGLLSVPTRPGLGFRVDPAKVRRYQVQHREFTARTGA